MTTQLRDVLITIGSKDPKSNLTKVEDFLRRGRDFSQILPNVWILRSVKEGIAELTDRILDILGDDQGCVVTPITDETGIFLPMSQVADQVRKISAA